MSDFQKWQEKKVEKKREKKKEAKLKQKDKKAQGKMTESELIAHQKSKAQLEMLIGDRAKSESIAVGGGSTDDARFSNADREYAVDPTHREFKKVLQGHNKVVKRQRR